MAAPSSTPSIEDILDARLADQRAILLRAHTDPAFRRALLANPARALRDAFGVTLPPGLTLDVVQETPSRSVLVLPLELSGLPVAELSDDDLEAVAAGAAANLRAPVETLPGLTKR